MKFLIEANVINDGKRLAYRVDSNARENGSRKTPVFKLKTAADKGLRAIPT